MVKYTKQTKEQMMGYLEKRGSSLTEAAKIAGVSRTTLTRYLENGSIPTEWMNAIRAEIKDRKPTSVVKKAPVVKCAVCGKDISDDDSQCATNDLGLVKLGVEKIPTSGYYMGGETANNGKKQKMFRICQACYKKLDKLNKAPAKKAIKGKIATGNKK